MAHAEMPSWFRAAVGEGLQGLVVLSLPGTPAAETIALTADVWMQTLWSSPIAWDEQLDRPRLARAFVLLLRHVERWPAPKHVLDHLPPRPDRLKLAAPPLTPEQLKRNRAFMRRWLETLTWPKVGK